MLDMLEEWRDARVKLAVIASLLAYRSDHQQLFSMGGYEPLIATGSKADQICAFARSYEDEAVLVAAARFPARVETDPDWSGTEIPWPQPAARNMGWRDLLSGRMVECRSDVLGVETLLEGMPVVVLVPENASD
jgi:(1->4)-alpha-D-glucan 1-alpha-D-glucosylmutase